MFNHMEPPQMKQAPATPSRKPEKLLRLPEVESLVGLGKSSIYAGMKAGTGASAEAVAAKLKEALGAPKPGGN